MVDGQRSDAEKLAGGADTLPVGPPPTRTADWPDTEAGTPHADTGVARGAVLGRYVVLGHLGAGGMGVVLSAFDPELERKVAIKLLQYDPGPHADATAGRARLLREAQALARLSHPNIVAVHDVGTVGDRVWLAMEYVDGRTLTAWHAERPRRWPDILRTILAAAHGLAAAHAAGLVHRDFKPDNVMIGPDGRVRVMDFGLVRADGGAAAAGDPALVTVTDRSALDLRLTRAGAVMGTPGYMAPEQWLGAAVDARSDQFALCVTLWELLFDRRPFSGTTPAALRARVLAGDVEPPPRGHGVPSWLRAALLRGLQPDPSRRFPSLDALLLVLAHGQARVRNRRIAVAVGLTLLLGAGAAASIGHAHRQRLLACDAAGAEITALWNDERRTRLRDALTVGGSPVGDPTFVRVAARIDEWTAAWSQARAQVCREAEVDRARAPDLYARSIACLDDQRDNLESLLEGLRPAAAPRAVAMTTELPETDACVDPAALARRPPAADPAIQARVVALRRELRRANNRRLAGDLERGLADGEEVLAAAGQLGEHAFEIEAQITVGRMYLQARQIDRARALLTGAYVDAGALGVDDLAASAVSALVYAVGYVGGRPGDGLLWSQTEEMLVRRLGMLDTLRGGDLFNNRAVLHHARGDLAEARRLYERALAIRERLLGPDHPFVADILANLAIVHLQRGDFAAALAPQERLLASYTAAFGPDSPQVADALNNLAAIHSARGAHAEALAAATRAVALREATIGPDAPALAEFLDTLASVLRAMGRDDDAARTYGRLLTIREAAHGPDHASLVQPLRALGELAVARHDPAAAIPLLERAVHLSADASAVDLADARHALATALLARSDPDVDRVHALMTAAAAAFRDVGESRADRLADVESWLAAARPADPPPTAHRAPRRP